MKRCYLVFVFLMVFIFMGDSELKVYANGDMVEKPEIAFKKINIKNNSMDNEGMYITCDNEVTVSDNTSIELYKETSEVVEVLSFNNQKLFITKDDVELMSKIVSAESKGEPYEGKVAVASVILNRVAHPSFPKTVKEVIIQKNAFSCVRNNTVYEDPDTSCYNAVMDAIKGNDPTNNAVYFYNPKIATSNWMKNIDKTNVKTIGNHVFFMVH
ncbi:cell wall hydrolase [Clostridium amazonitimonense]